MITSAMIDEFKGTLANLQQVGAKGFILCADSKPDKWFGFQGTIDTDGDIRAILEGRQIPYVYMNELAATKDDLQKAIELYHVTDGPVVIIATQDVLESREALVDAEGNSITQAYDAPDITASAFSDSEQLDAVIDLINNEPIHLLWSCGALSAEEKDLVLSIAEKAGIALCDALSAPGYLPAINNGKAVENYLGVLGQYGTAQSVFEFLHTDGKLNPSSTQALFFLKNKIGQIDSPFSDGAHERKLNIVQVNHNSEHIAPFADTGLVMPVLDFLAYLDKHLDVKATVKSHREEKLASFQQTKRDAGSFIPSVPMSPNYFFHSLNEVVEDLALNDAYEYIGLYDVGHSGTYATRNVSRTGPSYSGWYGRGLMGDALQATGFLSFSTDKNIISFVGDGARNITSDIIPGILENLAHAKAKPTGNTTIFFFMNNALSIINSYQERIMFKPGGRQMKVVNRNSLLDDQQWSKEIEGVQLNQLVMHQFDHAKMRSLLSQKATINFVFVPTVNSNDGISIVDQGNWQY